jgi:hypothetical protein
MRTFVSFLLDESGSMGMCRQEAIDGFNAYVRQLREQQPDADIVFTLTKFNTEARVQYVGTPLANVPVLTEATYQPNGNTALYDAVARTVAAVDSQATFGDRILVVILTDGQENSSRETTLEQVRALIEAKQATGAWTFAFVMAGTDQWAQATSAGMGIPAANSVGYANTPAGTSDVMARIGAASASYAAGQSTSTRSFFAQPATGAADQPWVFQPTKTLAELQAEADEALRQEIARRTRAKTT